MSDRLYTYDKLAQAWRSRYSSVSITPATPPEVEPPTGPGYVRYQDLHQEGDTVGQALNRLDRPAIVTFPPGIFLLQDFLHHGGAIDCKKQFVRGIIGSGSGVLHDEGAGGTIFKMAENSSTMAGTPAAPSQSQGGSTQLWVIRAVDVEGDLTFKNFQIKGTEQGHNYHGLYAFLPQGRITISNVKVSGVAGDNGAPPGETFGISAYAGTTNQVVIENCEVDGRRSDEPGALWYSAAGITTGRSIGSVIRNCHSHHNGAASFVFYRAFDALLENCIIGTTEPRRHAYSTTLRPGRVNQEETDGIVHRNCVYLHGDQNQGVHITHSNTNRSFTIGGVTRSVVDGSLIVHNPVYTNIWGDNYFYIESWLTGIDGTVNNDSMVTPPAVKRTDGTNLPYKWAHGPHYLIS